MSSQQKTVLVFTGAKGVGKSMAAATFPPPDELAQTLVIDTEDSMNTIIDNYAQLGLKFGRVLRAYARYQPDAGTMQKIADNKLPWVTDKAKSDLIAYYEWVTKELAAELKSGKYKHLIIDTVEPLESAFAAVVENDPKKFGWSGSRGYGKLEVEGIRPLYEGFLEACHAAGVANIILTSHIKPVWLGDTPVPNKIKPGGRLNLLSRLSTGMFWLVMDGRNPDGAPAALVIKSRYSNMVLVDGRLVVRRPLPRRIPAFNWRNVQHYLDHPADFANPAEGEIPSEDEEDMIGDLLNNAQMRFMMLAVEKEIQTISGQGYPPQIVTVLNDEQRAQVQQLRAQDMPNALIARRLELPLAAIEDVTFD